MVPLIVGNWKMHGTRGEAVALASSIRERSRDEAGVRLVVCPPFPHLEAVGAALRGSHVEVGAQNVHWEPRGAYTGEVSAPMLVEAGCRYVIIGHSERRRHLGETDETVRRKLRAALDARLTPIVCVGETEAERGDGLTPAVLQRQIHVALEGLPAEAELAIAYEPVWAIGTGRTATPAIIRDAHGLIDRLAAAILPGTEPPVLYGGSVTPENAASILDLPEVGGVLVGGASLIAESFLAICRGARPRSGESADRRDGR
jgi:triosephosphate isomerase